MSLLPAIAFVQTWLGGRRKERARMRKRNGLGAQIRREVRGAFRLKRRIACGLALGHIVTHELYGSR